MSTAPRFAHILRCYVDRSLYTAGQLNKLTGISRDTLINWLNDVVSRPRAWWDLLKISTALHLNEREADELLAAAGHPPVDQLRPGLRAHLQGRITERDRTLLRPWLVDSLPPRVVHPAAVDPAILAAALEQFARLPLDRVPERAPLPPGSRMRLSHNPYFVDRGREMLRLALLIKGGDTAIDSGGTAATTGLGGVGKSQLAAEFAHRYGQFFVGGVFWISFADPGAVADQVAACGGPYGLDLRPNWQSMSRDDQVELVWAAWQSPLPRLLIFDNCEDESLLQAWLPPSGGSRVLVTSRRAEWAATLRLQCLSLDVLDRESSLNLLQRYLDDAPIDKLDAIAEELGDLPLALHLSASYLRHYRYAITINEYLEEMRRLGPLTHPSLRGGGVSPTGHLQNVARTFALSFDRLDPENAIDALALRLLARAIWFAPGEPIPRDLLLESAGIVDDAPISERIVAQDAIARLHALGLTQPDSGGALRLHRLVVAFVRERLTGDTAQADVERVLATVGEKLCDMGDVAAVQQMQQHLRAATELAAPRDDERAADLLAVLGNYHWLIADYDSAQAYLERSLAIRRHSGREDPLKIAASYNLLGLLFQMRCDFGRARQLYEDAIAIWERYAGPDDPRSSTEHNNLGYLLLLLGDYPAAEAHLRYALAHRRQHFGLCNFGTARRIHNVGYLRMKQGDYIGARRYLKLALRIRERILAPNHPGIGQTLNFLGEVHYLLGDYESALQYHNRELALRRALHGETHHTIAGAFCNIGRVLHAQGSLESARAYLKQALDISIRALGVNHRETAYVLSALGALQRDQGELESARETLSQAIAAWEAICGVDHPELVPMLNHLGQTRAMQGCVAEAVAICDRALAICRLKLDPRHPQHAATLFAIGWVRHHNGDLEGALDAYSRAESIAAQRLPAAHPLIEMARAAIAAVQPNDLRERLRIHEPQQPRQ